MKITFVFSALVLLFTSCNKDPYYESETNEHFVILQEEVTSLTNVPVQFYWIKGSIDSLAYATSCLNTNVKFEKPYLIANGLKFHVYRWQSSQHIADSTGRKTSRLELRFYPE
jgi:hypothetical protein